MKLELLERYCSLTSRYLRVFKHHTDSFTIKEVRSAAMKGKGIPQSLRAAARVLSCTSAEELRYMVEEATEHDGRLGRRPFKNTDKEIRAHEILLSQITAMIGRHADYIKLLGPISSSPVGDRHAVRERMAYNLLAGELRVLESASMWLLKYVSTLQHPAESKCIR